MVTQAPDQPAVAPHGTGLFLLPVVFAMTLFVSSTLLFVIQPLFARLVLPLLGGSPAVWNTCLVFYQGALLLGYAYAHFSTAWLGVRRQLVLHLGLILLPLLVLPVAVPAGWAPPAERNPIPWLLALLAVSVALPFVVVSTRAPLLQRWFAASGHPDAHDPYFLYAASNAGSLLALLSYPLLLEPNLTRGEQGQLWSFGYGFLVVLIAGCGLLLWRAPVTGPADAPADHHGEATPDQNVPGRPSLRRRLHWLVLALVPSSLLPAVTTHITTAVAAIPLLWVLPLPAPAGPAPAGQRPAQPGPRTGAARAGRPADRGDCLAAAGERPGNGRAGPGPGRPAVVGAVAVGDGAAGGHLLCIRGPAAALRPGDRGGAAGGRSCRPTSRTGSSTASAVSSAS
jgi:hypothetical protein